MFYFNSVWPGNAIECDHAMWHLRTWSTLVQVKACHQTGVKPFIEPIQINWTLGKKLKWNLNQNTIFMHENGVCKMSTIFVQASMCRVNVDSWILKIGCYHQRITGVNRVCHPGGHSWDYYPGDLSLTHWGIVTPYGDIDLGQHWLR